MSDTVFGNTGTTVLFAILVTAASLVMVLIVIMSSKYSARTYFGIYDPVISPTIPHYSLLNNPTAFERANQPYVTYNGETFFLDDSTRASSLSRKINKLDVLTSVQLETLFPFQSYKDWNNGGREDARLRNKGVLGYMEEFEDAHEGEIEELPSQNTNKATVEEDLAEVKPIEQVTIAMELIPSSALHFDSGLCAICLEDLEDQDVVRGLICGHVFHKDCIDPWLTRRKCVCPTCKRDLYLKSSEDEAVTAETAPGARELDQIVNVSHSNPHAFFLVSCLTEYKAMVLLSALELVRLRAYNSPTDAPFPVQVDTSLKSYQQPLLRQEATPPRPDLDHLNKQIKNLLEATPRVFNESDLHEIDQLAMTRTNRLYRGLMGRYLKWINVTWDDVYFLSVIKYYEANRALRLAAS